MCESKHPAFMFLGYVDDSGRFDKKKSIYRVLSTVLVHDRWFGCGVLEQTAAQCIVGLLPPEKWETFEEFHAFELYRGCGVFEGIDQDYRFAAIRQLLTLIRDYKMPVVYGAVDVRRLQQEFYASADPIDIAFRICLTGIGQVMGGEQHKSGGTEFALLIVDDSNRNDRNRLKQTYREFRKHLRPPHWHPGTWYLHDDMYFGASKDSIGIQLADLVSYFIGKHLENDEASEGFYQIFNDLIVYSKLEPDTSFNQQSIHH